MIHELNFSRMNRIAVGMSGGVDSAVSALLLKQRGFIPHGIYMTNWDALEENNECTGEADWDSVKQTCASLNISCSRVNFTKQYWNQVFDPFLHALGSGTPNPDVMCNRYIKFDVFHKHARSLGYNQVAFGHYAQKSLINGRSYLCKAVDELKDQTYYLSMIKEPELACTHFPIGHLRKPTVKDLARANNLSSLATRKESMGICFIGKRSFASFISQYIPDTPGTFINVDSTNLGSFPNISGFTIGQRARIGGSAKKYYIVSKDFINNSITLTNNHLDPLFFRYTVTSRINWITEQPDLGLGFLVKYRYRSAAVTAMVVADGDGFMVKFFEAQHGLCKGQIIVLYRGDICYGGGSISSLGPSLGE